MFTIVISSLTTTTPLRLPLRSRTDQRLTRQRTQIREPSIWEGEPDPVLSGVEGGEPSDVAHRVP
jgi:hypothetical protein